MADIHNEISSDTRELASYHGPTISVDALVQRAHQQSESLSCRELISAEECLRRTHDAPPEVLRALNDPDRQTLGQHFDDLKKALYQYALDIEHKGSEELSLETLSPEARGRAETRLSDVLRTTTEECLSGVCDALHSFQSEAETPIDISTLDPRGQISEIAAVLLEAMLEDEGVALELGRAISCADCVSEADKERFRKIVGAIDDERERIQRYLANYALVKATKERELKALAVSPPAPDDTEEELEQRATEDALDSVEEKKEEFIEMLEGAHYEQLKDRELQQRGKKVIECFVLALIEFGEGLKREKEERTTSLVA